MMDSCWFFHNFGRWIKKDELISATKRPTLNKPNLLCSKAVGGNELLPLTLY